MPVDAGTIYLGLAILFGLFMAWGIGANDVANAMGTSVGAKALTVKQAIFVAIIFEFCGAWLAGGEVTSTIRKGIIDSSLIANDPDLLVFGMLSSLLAAGIWLAVASGKGWPVSTTHSIVGAIVGFAAVGVSVNAVEWGKVGSIAASWVVSPLLAGSISFGLFWSVRWIILDSSNPLARALRFIPFYMFLVGFLIGSVTLLKGLKNIIDSLSRFDIFMIAAAFGLVTMIVGTLLLRRLNWNSALSEELKIERVFAVLMVFTACAMAFAHGSNDVANAIGPLAAIYGVVSTGAVAAKSSVPSWILLVGAVGIVIGLATFGYRVMGTIGQKITELTPSRGFAAELGAATTVVVASLFGLPVSTTHTLVGAVLGVGLANAAEKVNFKILGTIVLSWIITIPVGAILSIAIFFLLKTTLG